MLPQICLSLMVLLAFTSNKSLVFCGGALGDDIGSVTANRYNTHLSSVAEKHHKAANLHSDYPPSNPQKHYHHRSESVGVSGSSSSHSAGSSYQTSGSGHVDNRNSYNLLSEAMSQAVSNEFHAVGSGSADGACQAEDLDCYSGNIQDKLGMEAIRTLHRQLDDDDNGNIDLSESDDFLREELKYDSGYEKRQKAFHFNDDMHISVKELWEAWLRSEVHNWTIEQTTDWLAQSVQLPQYVDLFKQHKVIGAALPRLAVNNMHYVSNVLGIKDPIHKQKIALKAMDVVLFGPPRETGTRWKDYILVTLLLSAIIGCWYAYQQNKNAKRHLRRMAKDMEGLQRAEQSLQEMQKELERARMEQENVATEKLDLERRLKEAPSLSSSNSDLEVQKLKKEIEILRTELSRAEIELVDNCWSPPPQLQSWLQYTYELESKNHLKKRISAEKQLQSAREACEKLRKKRSSLVGAFVSTHGKSIDDVDRSIVEARNSLGEVTNELQERLHRWKQIESCLGLNIVNNNGLTYLESVLYGRGNGLSKSSRGRMTSSTDDLDDESVQGYHDSYGRISGSGGMAGSGANTIRDDSSGSEDGTDIQSVQFYLGSTSTPLLNVGSASASANIAQAHRALHSLDPISHISNNITTVPSTAISSTSHSTAPASTGMVQQNSTQNALPPSSPSSLLQNFPPSDSEIIRSHSTDLVPMELYSYLSKQYVPPTKPSSYAGQLQSSTNTSISTVPSIASVANASARRVGLAKMVKQHSNASQQSTSSTSSSVQSAPPNTSDGMFGSDHSPTHSNMTLQDRKRDGEAAMRTKPVSNSLSLQSLCGKPVHGDVITTSISDAHASLSALTFSDTQMEHLRLHKSAPDNTSLAGSDLKKKRRKLRFPFGGKKSTSIDNVSKSKPSA